MHVHVNFCNRKFTNVKIMLHIYILFLQLPMMITGTHSADELVCKQVKMLPAMVCHCVSGSGVCVCVCVCVCMYVCTCACT